MQNRIIPMDELKALLDKYFQTNADLPDIMADFNDALEGGCKFALLQFDDDDNVSWDFLADVRVCDDPDCTIDHDSETGMSHDTFSALDGSDDNA